MADRRPDDALRLSFDSASPTSERPGREKADAPPALAIQGAPAGYGYGMPGLGDRAHLLDYVRVLHKRRWTALTAFLIVFGSVTVYTFTATPVYSARAQVLIENENPNVVKFEEVYDQNKATNDYYQTQYRLLQSRLLARRTLDAEKLWGEFGSQADTPFSLNPARLAASAANAFAGLFSTDVESAGADESREQSIAIDRFLRGLTVTPIRNSRLVDVIYRSPRADLSARISNALAAQYIEQNLEFKFLATKEANDFLAERMTEQRKSLEQSEQALQRYRERTGAVAFEDRQNIVIQRLSDLSAAMTRARTERIAKEATFKQIQAIQNDRAALDTFPAILNNLFIQQLKTELSQLQRQKAQMLEKLGPRHPDMVKVDTAIDSTERRMTVEVQKVVQALRNDYQAALASERGLEVSLNEQRAEAQELNRASIQYGALQRDTASNQSVFENLLQRSKETGISSELRTSNIRIVDQAEVPRRPVSPNKQNNLLFALFGGALLGIGLAFFFEYVDNRIKQPEEIKTVLGLSFLGMVPAFAAKDIVGPPLLGNGVPNDFSESFRSIRTNMLFASADSGSKSVIVTSTAPSEGKTVVAANLAMSLALAGQRVLLIDADMRRPKAHELFKISPEPGLSNVMVGDSKASETVKKTLTPNLWFLAAGKQPPNPAELLGSKRFADFLASLHEHFDWVLIDTPPVMAVTDASILAHGVNGVVFVVGSEMTSKSAAKAALEQLDSVKAKYAGGILNKVDLQRNAYYYSRYFRKDYQAYYAKGGGKA